MVDLKLEIDVKTITNITINICELYNVKESKIYMVNIDFCIQNKRCEIG